MPLIPVGSGRQPYIQCGIIVFHGSGDRCNQHLVAKHILVPVIVCLLAFRIIVVQRTADGQSLVIRLTGHCVNIRRHLITLQNSVANRIKIDRAKHPGLFVQHAALRRMSTHHRTDRTKLHPACKHLRVNPVCLKMPS